MYRFDAKKTAQDVVDWVREQFAATASPDTKAVVGISGGKDSSVAAAVCVKALGADRVVGVLMPQGEQADIDFARLLVSHLGIKSYEINVGKAVAEVIDAVGGAVELNAQARINTPARVRMTTLYAVAACVGGRVINTCNASEDYVGYSTKYGDAAGDLSPLSDLTVTEVIAIGDELGLPRELTHKVPIDGLCGKTDEENLGFTYAKLDQYIRGEITLSDEPELKDRIERLHRANLHKLRLMPKFEYKPEN
ncbi:MAG: NAD(+) synthase [Ruminococcus sp.]|nr:NAD(+) synthase [Ruminococcus sp.]